MGHRKEWAARAEGLFNVFNAGKAVMQLGYVWIHDFSRSINVLKEQ
jgi:hypothetical protein